MLKVEGIAFRFLPDPIQIKNALEVSIYYNSLTQSSTLNRTGIFHRLSPMTLTILYLYQLSLMS